MDQSCTSITSNIQIPESVVHTLQTYEELSLFSVNPTKIPISPLKQISKLYHSNYLDRIRHSMIDFQREIVRGRICKSKIADIYIYIYIHSLYTRIKRAKKLGWCMGGSQSRFKLPQLLSPPQVTLQGYHHHAVVHSKPTTTLCNTSITLY